MISRCRERLASMVSAVMQDNASLCADGHTRRRLDHAPIADYWLRSYPIRSLSVSLFCAQMAALVGVQPGGWWAAGRMKPAPGASSV
jgi:hypothetical protein